MEKLALSQGFILALLAPRFLQVSHPSTKCPDPDFDYTHSIFEGIQAKDDLQHLPQD